MQVSESTAELIAISCLVSKSCARERERGSELRERDREGDCAPVITLYVGSFPPLCSQSELAADDTHGSGCNYDYRLIWSSTPCNTCGSGSGTAGASHVVEWGYSKYLDEAAFNRVAPECRSSTDLAFVRCCADACDAATANAVYAEAFGNATTPRGNQCLDTSGPAGVWPATSVDSTAVISCPGTSTGTMSRQCSMAGWVDEREIDRTSCTAPDACDVCKCSGCGGDTGIPCGGSVGLANAESDAEFFVDCSVRQLVVAPSALPSNTTKLNMAGNPWLTAWPASMFSSAGSLRTMYVQGLLVVPMLPFHAANMMGRLHQIDLADLHAVAAFQQGEFVRALPALRSLVFHSFNQLAAFNRPFVDEESLPTATEATALNKLEIGNCPRLVLADTDLDGAKYLTEYKLVASSGITSIPARYFRQQRLLRTVEISFNRLLRTLPAPLFASGLLPTAKRMITLQTVEGLHNLARGTFANIGDTEKLIIKSGGAGLTIDDMTFEAINGTLATLETEGFAFVSAGRGTFAGASITNLVVAKANRSHSPDTAAEADEQVSHSLAELTIHLPRFAGESVNKELP